MKRTQTVFKDRSFLNVVENTIVHEENLDTSEFGKGTLSANVNFFDNHCEVAREDVNLVLV